MRTFLCMLVVTALATPALAQPEIDPPRRTIQVVGIGKVSTPPDVATIAYSVVGEGSTADAAATSLAAKQSAIRDALQSLLARETVFSTGTVSMAAVRGPKCASSDYGRVQLSQGECAVAGHVARAQWTVRTAAIASAGTAVALAGRLGSVDARIQSFGLRDDAAARRQAMGAAIGEARERAQSIAAGSGSRLGPLLMIRDQNTASRDDDIVVTANLRAPSPPPAQAPIVVDVVPTPIETRAQISVVYAIAP